MEEKIIEIIDTLEMLTEDLSLKVKTQLERVIEELKKLDEEELDVNQLMKIQDELEAISNVSNIDNFSRNEIMNSISIIETIYNS